MNHSRCTKLWILLLGSLIYLEGCKTIPVKREIKKVQEISSINPSNKFIKTHMKDGKVYILHDWKFDSGSNQILGYGSLLDINRNVTESRSLKSKSNNEQFKISLTEIALIETNDPGPSIAGGLAVVTGITGVIGLICITNPKACFGSCPTFYASNGDSLVLQAEGFSASVSPALEKNDVDMLYSAKPEKDFELVVTNEALETHSIRYANLLVFEKEETERVFAAADGLFYKCPAIIKPTKCSNQQQDCLTKILRMDEEEYFSSADSLDLNSKEDIFLSFNLDESQAVGLVIGKRQTLLTTFLMYQGLAYMGNSVTYWMAQLEQGNISYSNSVFDLLGGIEVFSKDASGGWKLEGTINETGPIATDFNIIPLADKHRRNIELRLRMNKGLWRINYLALATISGKVQPTIIRPENAERIRGAEPDPLSRLNSNGYLVTYPGDEYKIKYHLPFTNAELFLDSKGYYLEWIRDEWTKEQSFKKLYRMISKPSKYLRSVSRDYKKLEPTMEKTFWQSRYVKK